MLSSAKLRPLKLTLDSESESLDPDLFDELLLREAATEDLDASRMLIDRFISILIDLDLDESDELDDALDVARDSEFITCILVEPERVLDLSVIDFDVLDSLSASFLIGMLAEMLWPDVDDDTDARLSARIRAPSLTASLFSFCFLMALRAAFPPETAKGSAASMTCAATLVTPTAAAAPPPPPTPEVRLLDPLDIGAWYPLYPEFIGVA